MKNKIFIWLLLLLSLLPGLHAQFLDNRVNVYFGTGNGKLFQEENVSEGGVITPALFGNFQSGKGFQLKAIRNITPVMGIGLEYSTSEYSDWQHAVSEDFLRSAATQKIYSSIFRYQSIQRQFGLLNRLRLYGEISPGIGVSNISLERSLMETVGSGNINQDALKSFSEYIFGFKTQAGAEFLVHRLLGFYVAYSFYSYRISSAIFLDKGFAGSQLEVGVYFRFDMNKRYYQ